MFGRGKAPKTARRWKDAPDPGTVGVLSDARPDADLAATVLRRVLAEVGGDEVTGFEVTASVTADPLIFTVEALWCGVLADSAETAVGSETTAGRVDTVLNRWNAGHTVPRAHAGLDSEGRLRVRADSALTCGAGVTVQQLDEWVRRALAGLTALGEFLGERWPDALTTGEGYDDAGPDGEAPGPPVADGDITALVTEGNRYGLLGGSTPPVLLPRVGLGIDGRTEVREPGVSGRRGNSYLRFAAGPDVALHDGTLTVSDGASLGRVDADTTEWLHSLCGRMNALTGNVVSVVDSAVGGVTLTCAAHRPVGSGLSDAQLADAVTRDRVAVGETLRILLAEITGATGATGQDGRAAGDGGAGA